MPEIKEEDEVGLVMIPLKNVIPTIPKKEFEMKELVEDLTRMGCEGMLAKPWNVRNEAVFRGFLFTRGSQWERMMRQDPEWWTTKVWADVYGFAPRKGEGWANRKDTFFVRKVQDGGRPKGWILPG
jgi:hypothetical protein